MPADRCRRREGRRAGGLWRVRLPGYPLFASAPPTQARWRAGAAWWWCDVIYYSFTAACVGGIVRGDPNLVVAGGLPMLVILGATTVYALITERRRAVRIYLSGRRYLFRSSKDAF